MTENDLRLPTRPLSLRLARGLRDLAILLVLLGPYLLLLVMSLGSGWSFPQLVPNRVDLLPWKRFLNDRDGLLSAVGTSAMMSVTVGLLGTAGGLLIGRSIRKLPGNTPRFLIYLPFVISPVVVGICLYDLLIRLHLAGTVIGTVMLQTVFALSLASVFFSELWSSRAERLELLVSNLGGGRWAVFRHAIWPQSAGLIAISFVQTALLSWLDYGLVSVVGGGHVRTVTVRLFSSLHEANVNQAAQSSLVLLAPCVAGFTGALLLLSVRIRRTSAQESSS